MHEAEKLNASNLENTQRGVESLEENSPERLLAKKYLNMESDFSELENGGFFFLENTKGYVGRSANGLKKNQKGLEIEKRLSEIAGKGMLFLVAAKKDMKKAVAMGMAVVAFSGAVGKFGENFDESIAEGTKIESTNMPGDTGVVGELPGEKGNVGNEVEIVELGKYFGTPEQEAENMRKILLEHVSGQDYLDRLAVEFGGDIEKAGYVQSTRMYFLKNTQFNFMDSDLIDKKGKNISDLIPLWLYKAYCQVNEPDMKIGGFYETGQNRITLSDTVPDNLATVHEIFHASTDGVFNIPEETKLILQNSYLSVGDEERDAYLSNPSERLARKQQLDLEMDDLGVKAYGEKFTPKNYEFLLKLYEEQEFSAPAREFIMTTKPEYFELIFNEIATDKQIDVSGLV
jgi:hypothetical protein